MRQPINTLGKHLGHAAVIACLSLSALIVVPRATADDPIRLQLKWLHQFQFAGYYAAKAQGYYADAGLDVEIIPAKAGIDPVAEVLEGRADYGVGTSELLLTFAEGEPVVVLAAVFQHSALALIGPRHRDIQTLHDLAGQPLAIEPGAAELIAYLAREGIDPRSLDILEHDLAMDQLLDGTVAAQSAYVTTEPYKLQERGYDYQIYSPRAAGIDFYGDNLFTTRQRLEQQPNQVRAFREASMQGWAFAMEHPHEIIDLILEEYAPHLERGFLEFEAARMQQLVRADILEPGHMLPGRWHHTANVYAEVGMLPGEIALEGFVYDPTPEEPDLTAWYIGIAGGAALLLLVSGIAFQFHRLNRRLQASQRRYRTAYETAPMAYVVMDRNGRITDWNRSATETFGWTREEVLGRTIYETLIPDDEHATVDAQITAVLTSASDNVSINANITRDGRRIICEWRNWPWYDDWGRLGGVFAMGANITARYEAEEQVHFLAHHDALTRLPNRTLFFDRLRQSITAADRHRHKAALCFLDLDGFKPINDEHGHQLGDQLLAQAAERLSNALRESDTVARFGGDEFVILLPHVADSDAALAVAEDVRRDMAQPFVVEGNRFTISCSIGVAIYPDDGDTDLALTRSGDRAMYSAKRQGGNQVERSCPA